MNKVILFSSKTVQKVAVQNQQNANFLQESSQIPLKAEFLALKCLVIDELSNIRENI